MKYDPADFSNRTQKGIDNRLWLERNLIVDDLPRAGIRKERNARGGGIGPWLARTADTALDTAMGSFLNTVPEESKYDQTGAMTNSII
jgi:hypothetical protein